MYNVFSAISTVAKLRPYSMEERVMIAKLKGIWVPLLVTLGGVVIILIAVTAG